MTDIAEYLRTSRKTVYATLRRWVDEGVAGLDDKSRAPVRRVTKVTLVTMVTVRDLQENPELGEWRIHAALKQLGIEVSPRTCARPATALDTHSVRIAADRATPAERSRQTGVPERTLHVLQPLIV